MKLIVPALIVALLLEGLIRKSLAESGAQVLLVKDAIIILMTGFALAFHRKALGGFWRTMGRKVVILFSLTALLSIFSLISLATPIPMYLLGFREYFFYSAILLGSYSYFTSERSEKVLIGILMFAVLVDVAAICQALGLISSHLLLPMQTNHQTHTSHFGDFVFISSVFDVPERFAVFNLFVFLLSYVRLRDEATLLRREFLVVTLLASLISLFISGRRVSFLVALAFAIVNVMTQPKSIRKWVSTLAVFMIAVVGGGVFFMQYESALVKVIFNREIFGEIWFYLKQAIVWYSDAFTNAGVFTGYLGLTSPGAANLIIGSDMPFPNTTRVEGLWDKTLISMGVAGSTFLLASVLVLLWDLRRIAKVKNDPTISTIYYFVCCVAIWNIKSGEFLVWAPFTYLLVGMSYRLSHDGAVNCPGNQSFRQGSVRDTCLPNIRRTSY